MLFIHSTLFREEPIFIIFDGEVEKAITLYMDKSISRSQLETDLTEIGHVGYGETMGISMTRVELLDKTAPVFEEGEA